MPKQNEIEYSSRFKSRIQKSNSAEPDQVFSAFFQNLGRLGQSKPNRPASKRAVSRSSK